MKLLLAWKKCSKLKRKGGLGIINPKTQNSALLLKHLDKFYNKEVPWVKLIWHAHYSKGNSLMLQPKNVLSGGVIFKSL
jgi:hypothetical protein